MVYNKANPSQTNKYIDEALLQHLDDGIDDVQLQAQAANTTLTDHLNDPTDAHDASAISFVPTGTIASTDVQAAIAEVASEAVGGTITGLAVIDTVATLKGTTGVANGEYRYLAGSVSINDAGEGLVRRNTGLSSSNEVTIYDHNTEAGGWERVYSGPILLPWAGGKAGDTAFDNIPKLNAAILAAQAAGGGTVRIPERDYYIAPTPTGNNWIQLQDFVNIEGLGRQSNLIVRPNNGNYAQIFSGTTRSTAINDLALRNFRIDQNSANVTNVDVKQVEGFQQVALYCFNANNIKIENVDFDTCTGTNTVVFNGANIVNQTIHGCYFNFNMATNVAGDYDNSAIYFNTLNHRATNNFFLAAGAHFGFARGCIESHGNSSVIHNNHGDGYETLCNVVTESVTATPARWSNDLSIVGNVLRRGRFGIVLWAGTGFTMRNVLVADNLLSIAQVEHDADFYQGISTNYSAGANVQGDYDGIKIIGNTIRFQDESATPRSQTTTGLTTSQSGSAGLGFRTYGSIRNFEVLDNTVENAPTKGIMIETTATSPEIRNFLHKGNHYINCGTNSGVATSDFRSAIFIGGTIAMFDVTNTQNRVISTHDTMTGNRWGYLNPAAGSSRVRFLADNEVWAKAGAYTVSKNTNLTEDMSPDRGTASATITLLPGDARIQRFDTTLTQNINVVVGTTGFKPGSSFRIVRTGLGAFNINVASGLRTLTGAAVGWVEIEFDGTAWRLAGWQP